MKDTRSAEVPEPVLATLVALLDVVVLERMHGGAFRQLGGQPSPAWFVEMFVGEEPGAPVTLVQAFPVLDAFLSEAEIFWERTGFGRLEGEAFVVTGPGGHNLPLSAVAVAMEGRRFLLIQRVAGFDDRQHILQRAREQALAHEQIVKQIHALRRPFAKLTELTGQLALSGEPSEAQRALLSGIHAEIETLGQVLDGLPKLPPGVSARRG